MHQSEIALSGTAQAFAVLYRAIGRGYGGRKHLQECVALRAVTTEDFMTPIGAFTSRLLARISKPLRQRSAASTGSSMISQQAPATIEGNSDEYMG
jgi:GMP synthase PP-ATPase subunit